MKSKIPPAKSIKTKMQATQRGSKTYSIVYRLYNLTPEEIKIVEESTQ